jgi:hypothetical protein
LYRNPTFRKIPKNIAKILFYQKTHGARRGDEGRQGAGLTTRGRGPALAAPTCGEAMIRHGVDDVKQRPVGNPKRKV